MSSGMPELGSKISLISKADIRYEGRLFTVDPQECTIALASVRSFGTEDRETQYPVAPQNQVYDYILFRGSDIKDIRVVNNVPSLPNDPAIMQLSVPPSLGPGGGGVAYQQPQFSHPVVGPAQYPAYHPMAGLPGGLRAAPLGKQPSELSVPPPQGPPPGLPVELPNRQAKDQGSMLEMISGASRSETPLGLQRKSPTVEQGTQMGSPQVGGQHQQLQQGKGPNQHNKGPHNNTRNQQRPRSQNRNVSSQNMNQQNQQQHHQQQPSQQQQHHQNQNQQHNQQQHNQPQHNQQQHNQQQHNQPQHNQQHNQQQQQQHHQQQQQQQHNQQQHNQQLQNNQGPNGMRQNNQGWIRGRGGRGGRGGPRGGGFGGGRGGNRTKNTLKFDNDYDFEQANTEFEELRSQLAKVKILDGEVPKPEVETEKKDDSGNETGAGEPEPEEDADSANCYDKTKSFFDNISCEAVERSKGRSQRTDWRTERKLNSETFGVAMARRGGYRGRGYWGGGQGGGWGGGQGGGWGGRGGWRGPSNRGGQHRPQQHRNHPNNRQQQPLPVAAGK